jgi:hypothetical protein
MAAGAQRDQIIEFIRSQPTAMYKMMDVQMFRDSTTLALPSVTLQNARSELVIFFGLQDEAWSLRTQSFHGPSFSLASSRLRCSLGKIL